MTEALHDLFEEASQNEINAFENFREKYVVQVPPPRLASVRLMEEIGWQFILIIIQAIGAIVLASLRTADMFYLAAAGSSRGLALAEAIAAIIAVEVGIVVYASVRAEANNRKLDAKQADDSVKVSVKKLWIGEAIGIIVSVIAGLGVSFRGFGLDFSSFTMVLAFVIGIGASIIAAVSGDILGAVLARYGNIRQRAVIEHRDETAAWEEKMLRHWQNSPDRKIARGEMNAASARSTAVTNERTNERTNRKTSQNAVRNTIYDYLTTHSTLTDGTWIVPGPSQIARDLNCSKAYAKGCRDEWISNIGNPTYYEVPDEIDAE